MFPLLALRTGRLLAISVLVCGATASATTDFPAILANDNRVPAGRLENGSHHPNRSGGGGTGIRRRMMVPHFKPLHSEKPAAGSQRRGHSSECRRGPGSTHPSAIYSISRSPYTGCIPVQAMHKMGSSSLLPIQYGRLFFRPALPARICTGQVELERTACCIAGRMMIN
jgi:hypothetical protein